MTDRTKDDSRRERIFCALDRMQEAKERINAQKLAEEVRMGKQTVLPYYREWQELQAVADADDTELSLDLIRVLKREIGREKFKQAEEQRLQNEQYLEDIAHLTETVGKLKEALESREGELQAISEENQLLKTTLEQNRAELQQSLERFQAQETEFRLLQQQIEQNTQQLEQAEKDKTKSLLELEQRLDESHQKLLNHWIQVADRERQGHQLEQKRGEKQSEELQKTKVALSKQEVQLVQATAVREKLEAELHELTEENGRLQLQSGCLHDIRIKLGQPDDLAVAISHLQDDSQQRNELQKQLESLKNEQDELHKDNEELGQIRKEKGELEKEVVRLTAYLDGLQSTR